MRDSISKPFLTAVFAWALLFTQGASAAVLVLGAADVDTEAGRLVLPIRLVPGPNEEIAGLQFDLVYDAGALTFRDATTGSVVRGAEKVLHLNKNTAGHARFVMAGFNQNAIAEGVITECHFDVHYAALKTVPVSLEQVILSDPFGEKVRVTVAAEQADAGGNGSAASAAAPFSKPGISGLTLTTVGVAALLLALIALGLNTKHGRLAR